MLYPDEDFSDAAGVFFPSSDDAKSHTVILRSNVTSEAVCHEIGHVVHESNDPAAYGDDEIGRDEKKIRDIIFNTIQALRTKRNASSMSIESLSAEPKGIQTIVKNIDILMLEKQQNDVGHKELMANIVGIYLSGNDLARDYFEKKYSRLLFDKKEYSLMELALEYLRGVEYSV